uniref:Uncharacterized protein n=1 Tax=Meloidogyne enterolobii TaxID=390850 RepID=A0A6V7VXD4_MELEN|nr:unnamed protein product [Meloidogyne enterolobii]
MTVLLRSWTHPSTALLNDYPLARTSQPRKSRISKFDFEFLLYHLSHSTPLIIRFRMTTLSPISKNPEKAGFRTKLHRKQKIKNLKQICFNFRKFKT